MSHQENNISLQLSVETVDAQCLLIIRQARNTSHALTALIALQSFVAAMASPGGQHTSLCTAVTSVIGNHAAAMRALMLNEQAGVLADSLLQQDCAAITRTHGELARNCFSQAAQQAIAGMDGTALSAARGWARHWCMDAKSRAQAASDYPDALNFAKAGISPHEYAAMTEIKNYLMDTCQL